MSVTRVGPLVTVKRSCLGCIHETSKHYAVQGDSGCDVSCGAFEPPRYIADTSWDTPAWCPYLNERPNQTSGEGGNG